MTRADPALAGRIPPGQTLTTKWPVLTYGLTPRFDPARWTFRCFGHVEREVVWTWEEFLRLPRVTVTSDVHCVTRWSKLDNRWEGVGIRELMKRVKLLPGAKYVMVHADPDYTTNLALEDPWTTTRSWRCDTTGATSSPSTAARAGWSCQSSTSGRAPNGCAASSCWTSIRLASGSRTDTTCTPTPGKTSGTPTRRRARCRRCARRPRASSASDEDGQGWGQVPSLGTTLARDLPPPLTTLPPPQLVAAAHARA